MKITGKIISKNLNADEIERSLSPDNGGFIETSFEEGCIVAKVSGESLRSVIATVDDYLMNLSVAERLIETICEENTLK
ncbi:MAG TPA: KEOPS complex subunit Pcc1 [Methanocorpusculum sp.]|nr:KEOPS complex subunit Pcc1 [Methanocorpusculum sp.]HJJ50862.1 KEOPS complex subunit Pcc1 [Methanocorpusculum sp.]HJJ53169.1 KEOPS complex subunit Pcc1 [Methanocorpusculum sp.]